MAARAIHLAASTLRGFLAAMAAPTNHVRHKKNRPSDEGRFWTAAACSMQAIEAALADIPHVDHLVLLAGTFVAGKVMDADVAYLRRAFEERIWAAVTMGAPAGIISLDSYARLRAGDTGRCRASLRSDRTRAG